MCGNRVEELEELVKELEASVEGLTDELVECKVRIRELENTIDEEKGFGADEGSGTAAPSSDPESTESGTTSTEDEILTPGADTSKPDDTDGVDNKEEAASDSESDDDSGSDIIVA